jgi:hypothetical protein
MDGFKEEGELWLMKGPSGLFFILVEIMKLLPQQVTKSICERDENRGLTQSSFLCLGSEITAERYESGLKSIVGTNTICPRLGLSLGMYKLP